MCECPLFFKKHKCKHELTTLIYHNKIKISYYFLNFYITKLNLIIIRYPNNLICPRYSSRDNLNVCFKLIKLQICIENE